MSLLPLSLSPHICILQSNDLAELLSSSSLPPLSHILQSFSPLPQVTTRTTSLVTVPHTSFALRFSDLAEIEIACREDEEQRAVRSLEWIGTRIHTQCAKWVDDVGNLLDKDSLRTPWWDELRRCIEGDHIPSKNEAWNHPVAVILAVSTTAPNPLQAITTLHSRAFDLPPWIDRNILRYTLIIHPQDSKLSDEEAGALFNAVKRQYGLHSYLLSLNMPRPPPPPVPVPTLIPRLPLPSNPELLNGDLPIDIPVEPELPSHPNGLNTLKMSEKDIQQTARFTREFVVMSLLPWMEKCVVEWNENFSSTRRLPSRLFSSTRRFFGSPSPSPSPAPGSSSSVSPSPPRVPLPNTEILAGTGVTAPSQQRRLAEFATILGDLKLAALVWETLRKEGKGGSDILPLLLSPSPTLPLHASNALSSIHSSSSNPRALEQLSALKYAVRWEVGISSLDFATHPLDGERWLVWAAGNAEEPSSALLLAHAALLSSRKRARRRAVFWYLSAAGRMEKCGIKPLAMYFLHRARDLYDNQPQKTLSPSFWESEGKSPSDIQMFDGIKAGIEHPLGRLLYTTGDIVGAVRCFMGLLRGSSAVSLSQPFSSASISAGEAAKIPGTDKAFLDDFRIAFASISSDEAQLADLKLPFTFCVKRLTRITLPRDRKADGAAAEVWRACEEDWKTYWRSYGRKEGLLTSDKTSINENFLVDLVLLNPLDVEVNLSNVTVIGQELNTPDLSPAVFVEIESIPDIVLAAKELRTVSIRVKSSRPASLIFTHASYNFLSLLPFTEPLAFRGRRLHDTPAQRQNATYAPDATIGIEVEEVNHRLLVDFVEDQRLVLAHGERKPMRLRFSNTGSRPISEVWMMTGREDVIWVGTDEEVDDSSEIIQSRNSLTPRKPYRILLDQSSGFNPGDSMEIPAILYADSTGERELCLFFVYRENETDSFQSVQVSRRYEVHKMFDIFVVARPSQSLNHLFLVDLELSNLSSSETFHITQVTGLSAGWKCSPVFEHDDESLPPHQSSRLLFSTSRWEASPDSQSTLDFVSRKLGDVLHGRTLEHSHPPSINLLCSHIFGTSQSLVKRRSTWHLLYHAMRNMVSHAVVRSHPYIPNHSLPYIFPLHNPTSIDFIVSWTIPSQHRTGHTFVSGPKLGASHAPLEDSMKEVENIKVKRSIYAETRREKVGILEGIRNSEWNAETNPLILVLEEPGAFGHDFRQGSRRIPVDLTIRNYSSTHRSRFVFGLHEDSLSHLSAIKALSPPYVGQLTFRGTLDPSETRTFRPTLWITRPGTYSLGRWYLETEVLETSDEKDGWVRYRYRQEQLPEEDLRLIVYTD